MTEVEKWMLKHYTQDLDSMKCNYCQEIFSDCNRMQNFKYHIRNMHNVLELDEHPECDNIQKNYKISSLMATCNHCKKTINLAIHGVHVLTIHLKIFHSDKSKIKISRARDKYDIRGNKATCKGCKKTMKSTYKVTLHRHLYDCPHFKIDFLDKKELNKGITKKIKQKRSYIWGKYDITGNNATCKGCKKTLKINISNPYTKSNLYKHLHYCPHFKIDVPLKKGITYEITQKRSDIWNKYDVTDNNNATCKGCKKTLKVKVTSKHVGACLRSHLYYCPHFKTDFPLKKKITKQIKEKEKQITKKKRSNVWDKYDVMGRNATCKGCKKIVKIARTNLAVKYLLRHLHYCPHFKIDFPLKKEITFEITRKKSHIWNKYDVTDNNNATCKGCKKTMKVKVTSIHAAGCLRRHLYSCPHFKIDFLRKKESTFEITRTKSDVWNKYDITDNNNATCKGCKKTLKIKVTSIYARDSLRAHLHHCPHFKTDFPLKKEITFEITRKKSHIWNKYDVTDNNNATCKGCKKTLKVKVTSIHASSCLRRHLQHCPYFKIDFPRKKTSTKIITRKRSHVWDKYDIIGSNATCKGCKKTLNVKVTSIHAAVSLRQHLHYCPHFKIDFPRKKIITRKRSHVWDKYDIIGSNATCKGCKKTLNVKVTSLHAAVSLRQHLHYCPYFKNDFPDKKLKKITHMKRVQCNRLQCEVKDVKRKKNNKNKY